MIASWMLYALLVSLLLAAAAWTLEEVFRLRGLPVRFLWLGALLGTVAITAAAPLRSRPPVVLHATQSADVAAPRERPAAEGLAARTAASLRAVRGELDRGLSSAAALGGRTGTGLALGWIALSTLMLAITGATLLRARRARRRWPIAELSGERVRVAPGVGPAVLGIRRPEVVVPSWLLGASPREQRLVVIHEREHIRARDPLVLLAGCVAAAAVAWNPAAWLMLRRLRAAVELDCDARVLRHGVQPREYGAVLIDIAGRGPGLSLGAPALAGSPSILERRLRAMTMRLPRFARLRASALAVLGLAALASACETPLPTSAELETMDVAAVEARTTRLVPSGSGEAIYRVDGKQVTAEEAHALAGEGIVRMEVTRATAPGGGKHTIHIYTREGEANGVVRASVREPGTQHAGGPDHISIDSMRPTRTPGVAGDAPAAAPRFRVTVPARRAAGDVQGAVVRSDAFDGLLIVDGVVTPSSALRSLDTQGIASIEILKGEAATRIYDDPRAANGVIRVTTKAGATRQ